MSGFLDHLGIHPSSSDTGRPGHDAGLAVSTDESHTNVNGGVHGGLIATLLDATIRGYELVVADLGDRVGIEVDRRCRLGADYLSPATSLAPAPAQPVNTIETLATTAAVA